MDVDTHPRKYLAFLHCLSRAYKNLIQQSGLGRSDFVLHLHCFEYDDPLPLLHLIADGSQNLCDKSRHWRNDLSRTCRTHLPPLKCFQKEGSPIINKHIMPMSIDIDLEGNTHFYMMLRMIQGIAHDTRIGHNSIDQQAEVSPAHKNRIKIVVPSIHNG